MDAVNKPMPSIEDFATIDMTLFDQDKNCRRFGKPD